jgi:predicted RNA binding protein YcfA (HicA-like mRNA interferase family)
MNKRRLLQKALNSPQNMRFSEMIVLVEAFGFRLSRSSGSHRIFSHPDLKELLNLQEVDGKAKPYQVRQFLRIVEKYDLQLGEDE